MWVHCFESTIVKEEAGQTGLCRAMPSMCFQFPTDYFPGDAHRARADSRYPDRDLFPPLFQTEFRIWRLNLTAPLR